MKSLLKTTKWLLMKTYWVSTISKQVISFDDKGYFAVYDKDCQYFLLLASMRYPEYQITVSLKSKLYIILRMFDQSAKLL